MTDQHILANSLSTHTPTHPVAMSSTVTQTVAQPITAETMLRLFPDIDTSGEALEGHNEEQIRLMDEVCIVTDENDLPIGTASKKLCKYSFCFWHLRLLHHWTDRGVYEQAIS